MKIRAQIDNFINNTKEYPILGSLIIGTYAFLFYYSNNFENANSTSQFLFFMCYYIATPILITFIIDKIIIKTKWITKRRQILFVLTTSLLVFYIGQNINFHHTFYKVFLLLFSFIFLLSFKINNYKIIMVIICFMCILPVYQISNQLFTYFTNETSWTNQPDQIEQSKFVKRPNIYYIQMDGYTNMTTLRSDNYAIDNSAFDNWLIQNNFTHYPSFRSNYSTTLKSNSSLFMMKHHYSKEKNGFKNARDYIMNENSVLQVFKNNDYKTFFISERAYLLSNRPKIEFDYCNFTYSEVPFLGDGWDIFKEISPILQKQILENKKTSNFYFIEKFSPGHIGVYENGNIGIVEERKKYQEKIELANIWLKKTITFITKNDPQAIILINADHGGFVGFNYTLESIKKITNKELLNSIFGAKLAIKWNDSNSKEFDQELKTSVNLFRSLFAFLSNDTTLLNNFQENTSFAEYDQNDDSKVYVAIE